MSKQNVIMRDIVCKYNPVFKGRKIYKLALEDPRCFNVERLVELTLAHVGGYEFIDAAHSDFTDGSDSKTASISSNPTKPNGNLFKGEISNVITPGGNHKLGALRCLVYNPHKDEMRYYFLPKNEWIELGINIHPTTNVGRLFFTYNRSKDYINKIENWRVGSFIDLAKMK